MSATRPPSPSAPPAAPPQASPLARYALWSYLALMAYASLYPFAPWQSKGLLPWEWVAAPWPQYLTQFDIWTNIVGYMPLGMLWVWSIYPRWAGWRAVLSATMLGAALSFGLESLQTWLPQRVSSNLDWATNTGGALLGALLVVAWTPRWLSQGRLRALRQLWFERHSSFALLLLLLWPFAQIFPQAWFLGTGDMIRQWFSQSETPVVAESLRSMLPNLVLMREALLQDAQSIAQQQWWETTITASSWLAVGLFATIPMRRQAPRVGLLAALLVAMLGVKWLATALQFTLDRAWDWLTPGALSGLFIGSLLLTAALWLPRAWRVLLAMLLLILTLVVVNLLPPNPYYLIILQGWRQGRLIHFNGLAQWLGWLWPYLACLWLLAWLEARLRPSTRQDGAL